jgi:hypothetical protein
MDAPITKIQILTNKETGHPLFYCHSADRDHNPALAVEKVGAVVAIGCYKTLFKVKFNPQKKNRVDIYMSVLQAHHLGSVLTAVAQSDAAQWPLSSANPGAAARGNMELPTILWARYARFQKAEARIHSGTNLANSNGYINVDLEFPHKTHIKMKEHEIHIGIQLNPPTGNPEANKTFPVHVPEAELQRGRNETNPLLKVWGDFRVEIAPSLAAGLGALLQAIKV